MTEIRTTKKERSLYKLDAQTDRQTDRQTDNDCRLYGRLRLGMDKSTHKLIEIKRCTMLLGYYKGSRTM